MNIDNDCPGLPLEEWVPLGSVLQALRQRYAVNDGAHFITNRWDCKYLSIRLDMRTGLCYITPGNTGGEGLPVGSGGPPL